MAVERMLVLGGGGPTGDTTLPLFIGSAGQNNLMKAAVEHGAVLSFGRYVLQFLVQYKLI